MPESTPIPTPPDGATPALERHPGPLSIAAVWLLVARWKMALVPDAHGTWEVLAGYPAAPWPHFEHRRVPFAALPQAILDVAQRCEAAAEEFCYDEP